MIEKSKPFLKKVKTDAILPAIRNNNSTNFIESYCRDNSSSDVIYFPVEIQSVFKFSTAVFGQLPFCRTFKEVNLSKVKDLLGSLGFAEILKDEKFNKETKEYDFASYIHHNEIEKCIVFISSEGNDDDIEFSTLISTNELIESVFSDDKEKLNNKNKIVYIYVFYCSKTGKDWSNNFFSKLEEIALIDFKVKAKKNSVNFLCHDHTFRLKNLKIKKKMDGNLDLNYGEDFVKVHDQLFKFLESDETGLGILHGGWGTGKTFYLRYLLSVLSKKVIYIPPNMVGKIADPDFLSFILTQSDFILIIEDAEEVITNRRDSNNPTAVSNLLNLSDGILGECIKVKILVTFNCEISEIDPALLRKGRLRLQYEFKKLQPEQANKLFEHLKIDHKTTEPMSVGDIYSFNEDNLRKEKVKGKIGFGK